MPAIFFRLHIDNKQNEFVSLNFDFEKNVGNLKEEIAGRSQNYDAKNLEIIYNGAALDDDLKLNGTVKPNATVHCFKKTKKYVPYQPAPELTVAASIERVQELFNVIAHIQINVNSRVNILQKILAEYPEFRRNLGAQAFIRDSVLFNTLHHPEVIKNIAQQYPIICEAAPSIVDTIKKELTRSTSTANFSEPTTDSTNSSEEENSLGANSSERGGGETSSSASRSENARIRLISRQQLQAALAQIGLGSVNSLSNIAQRNSDTNSGGSGERITSELFRSELRRALNSLSQPSASDTANIEAPATEAVQQMDTSESLADNSMLDISEDGSVEIPSFYRTHQYAQQLRTMASMGFLNYEENLTYLNITNGNIENAVNLVMGSMN